MARSKGTKVAPRPGSRLTLAHLREAGVGSSLTFQGSSDSVSSSRGHVRRKRQLLKSQVQSGAGKHNGLDLPGAGRRLEGTTLLGLASRNKTGVPSDRRLQRA